MYMWIAAKSELLEKIWAGLTTVLAEPAQILFYNSLSDEIHLYMIRVVLILKFGSWFFLIKLKIVRVHSKCQFQDFFYFRSNL